MQKYSPQQSNEVFARIGESVESDSDLKALRRHVDEIARELADHDAFDDTNGSWTLSDRAWTDWLFNGGAEKYLDS